MAPGGSGAAHTTRPYKPAIQQALTRRANPGRGGPESESFPNQTPGWAGLVRAGLVRAGVAGLSWSGLGCVGLRWLGCAGLGWAGLRWAGLGWAGLGWAGLGWLS